MYMVRKCLTDTENLVNTYTREEIVEAAKSALENWDDASAEVRTNLEMIVSGQDEVGSEGANEIARKGDIFPALLSYVESV